MIKVFLIAKYSVIAELSITLALSLIYIFIFINERERYIGWWGFSWMSYSLSFVFDLFSFYADTPDVFFAGKQFLFLISSSCLLIGTYDFLKREIPMFWILLSSPPIIASVFFAFLLFPHLRVLNLMTSVILCLISVWTGYVILKNNHGKDASVITFFAGLFFILWGLHKGAYMLVQETLWYSQWTYIISAVLTNMLNVFILLIYFNRIRNQLMESEKKFRFLAEHAKDMIYRYCLKTYSFDYVSPAAHAITGYEPASFYENPEIFFNGVHQEDRQSIEAIRSMNLQEEEALIVRWIRKDGKVIWTEQQYSTIDDENGEPAFVEGILRDISDRRFVEEKLYRSEASRRYLITNVSHELRTPITSILCYVSALIDGVIAGGLQDNMKYLNLIRDKSVFLQRLIADLFQLTQLEAGQISFNYHSVQADELMKTIYNKFEHDVRSAGIEFQLNAQDIGNTRVLVDKDRIEQVFANLINNSMQHAAVKSYIRLEYGIDGNNEEDKKLLIKVIDNGNGISQQDIDHIFDRFFKGGRKKKGESSTGSGLGLAITREIVQAHRGEIGVDSEPQKGTAFYFTLPLFDIGKQGGSAY